MTAAWHVGVAENRRDELAEVSLKAKGIGVHFPRRWDREKTIRGKLKLTCELLISPYFYAYFDGNDDEEYSLARNQRGVSHFLENNVGGRLCPGSVPAKLIEGHREREGGERANLVTKRGPGRKDLELRSRYRVVRGVAENQIGVLFDFARGMAFLDINGKKVEVCDGDIVLLPAEEKRRA